MALVFNLCETCPLNGMEQQVPDSLVLTELSFIAHPDDARTVLHVTTGIPLEPATDAHMEVRRSRIIRKLASIPLERLGPVIALSECMVRKQTDCCPLPMSDEEYSNIDIPASMFTQEAS